MSAEIGIPNLVFEEDEFVVAAFGDLVGYLLRKGFTGALAAGDGAN